MGKPGRWWVAAIVAVVSIVASTSGVGAGVAGAQPSAGAVAQAACTLTPTAGTVVRMIGARSYRLHVPAGITGPNARLLVSLHGWGGTAAGHETGSGLSGFSDASKVIVAYPTGTYITLLPLPILVGWDYFHRSSPDVDFLRAVVADIAGTWCIDPHRVHADGISMGGLMSQRLACEASDVFASVSAHATNDVTAAWFLLLPSEPCTLPRPTSVYLSCGTADLVTNNGCAPAKDSWVARLGCPAPVATTDGFGSYTNHAPCVAGTQLAWRRWTGLGHDYPPAGAARAQWFAEMDAFFAANPKP